MGIRFAGAAFAAVWLSASGASAGWMLLPDDGRPVRASDLAGKTVCWDNGITARYGRDGHFTNSDGADTHWLAPEPGVIQTGIRYHEVRVMPDGQFRVHIAHPKTNVYHFGSVCREPVDAR